MIAFIWCCMTMDQPPVFLTRAPISISIQRSCAAVGIASGDTGGQLERVPQPASPTHLTVYWSVWFNVTSPTGKRGAPTLQITSCLMLRPSLPPPNVSEMPLWGANASRGA